MGETALESIETMGETTHPQMFKEPNSKTEDGVNESSSHPLLVLLLYNFILKICLFLRPDIKKNRASG